MPGRNNERGSHCGRFNKRNKCSLEQNEQKWSTAPDRVCVQHDFLLFVTGLKVKPMWKLWKENKMYRVRCYPPLRLTSNTTYISSSVFIFSSPQGNTEHQTGFKKNVLVPTCLGTKKCRKTLWMLEIEWITNIFPKYIRSIYIFTALVTGQCHILVFFIQIISFA